MSRIALTSVTALLLVLAGCTRQTANYQRQHSGLKPLAIFYGQFVGQHRGRPPADEAEFRSFLSSLPAERLKSFGVAEVGGIFTSSRDGKPYVVVYGPATPAAAGSPDRVIAYEETGLGGKRYVAFSTGKVDEVDEARFGQLVHGKH